jgi:hypothetical protein
MGSIWSDSADVLEVAPTRRQHPMPPEQHVVGKRFSAGVMEIDHHFRDALFRGADLAAVSHQAELPAD